MLRPTKLINSQPVALSLCLVLVCATLLGAAVTGLTEPADDSPAPAPAAPVQVPAEAPAPEEERELEVTYIEIPAEENSPAEEPAPEPEAVPEPEPEPEPASLLTTLPTPLVDCWQPTGQAPIVAVPKEGQDVPENLELVSTFLATAYCTTGTTATGTWTTIDRTLAVNPSMIPYGSHVWLFLDDGTLVGDFWAEDTGSNMMENPYVIDIYMGETGYDACIQWGTQHVTVYIEPET